MIQADPGSSPRWMNGVSAALTGWLVLLITMFVLSIAAASVRSAWGVAHESGGLTGWLLVPMVLALTAGIIVGRATYRWLIQKSATVCYVWATSVIVLAVISFPGFFNFSLDQGTQKQILP